jgi:hypothetical protein
LKPAAVSTFNEWLTRFAARATVADAQAALRSVAGRHTSKYVADAAGIAGRTARRWMSSGYPRSRTAEIKGLFSAALLAAQRARTVSAVSIADRVPVIYLGLVSSGRSDAR